MVAHRNLYTNLPYGSVQQPGGTVTPPMIRMLKRQLSMAFEKWQDEAAQMAREKYMLAGAVKRMLMRQLSMAFEKWQFTANQMAREKYMLAGAMKRMLLRQQSMAFEKWQFEAAALAREKFLMGGAVQRCHRNLHGSCPVVLLSGMQH